MYIRNTGLLHGLLGLDTAATVAGQPKRGASFEGFVIEQTLAHLHTRNASF